MKHLLFILFLFFYYLSFPFQNLKAEINFKKKIAPILFNHCVKCHGAEKRKGKLRLDSKTSLQKGGKNGKVIVAGKAEKSELFLRLIHKDEDKIMPQKADPLTKSNIKLIKDWINKGATWPDGFSLDKSARKEAMAQLKPFQTFVSAWKGFVRPSPRSDVDGWGEKTTWRWNYNGSEVSVKFLSPKSKLFVEGTFLPNKEKQGYDLFAKHKNGGLHRYTGQWDKEKRLKMKLIKSGTKTKDSKDDIPIPIEILIRQVSFGERLLINYSVKGRTGKATQFAMAGYTREGVKFGGGSVQNECLITGGTGSRKVSYKGKTYYVCCGGCLDEFNENPAAAVEAYLKEKGKK